MLAALRVMFTRSKKEMEGKTATELGRYKVCDNEKHMLTAVSSRIMRRQFPAWRRSTSRLAA